MTGASPPRSPEQIRSSMVRSWPAGATIPTSDVEEHHNWLRYRWKIVGGDGAVVSEGLHVAERGEDGRVR